MSDRRFVHTPDAVQENAAMPYVPDLPGTDAVGEAHQASRLEAARRRNERALMAIDGVEGVALGCDAAGQPAIMLYVHDAGVWQRVPRRVDGFPVVASVTGQITIV